MAVTLKDIAERTGVSPSVVSTVLSGRDNGTFVSETTRRKVLQVAEALNYTPVRSGRPRGSKRLRRQREEQFIGIWDPDYSSASASQIQHLQTALRTVVKERGAEAEDDFGLRLLNVEDLPRLDSIGVMGIVLLSSTLLPREAAVATIPCVMIGEVDNPPREVSLVHMDNSAAGRDVGDYLWSLGHRTIAYLAPGDHPRVTRQRYQGLKGVWIKHHADPTHVIPVQYDTTPAPSQRDQIRRAVQSVLRTEILPGRPTTLVCDNEHIAAVTAQALAEINIRVPQDVSLIAFHDTPRVADSMIPPLTTVRQPGLALAEASVRQLYAMHDEEEDGGDAAPRDLMFPGELIVRESCASPRA